MAAPNMHFATELQYITYSHGSYNITLLLILFNVGLLYYVMFVEQSYYS